MLIRSLMAGCLVAFLAMIWALPISAQSETATLSGRITDPQGSSVPKALVQIVNIDTNVVSATDTNSEGIYVFTGVKPGRYRLLVLKDGFHEIIRPEFTLHVQDHIEQNFGLQLGSVSESITVSAGDIHINTTDGSVSTVIDRQFVGNLPLNGRSFQSLILVAPGVVQTPSDQLTPGEFSVNGQRQNANYFTVDGVSANTGVDTTGLNARVQFSQQAGGAIPGTTALGTTASLVSIDALQEFKIQTSTYSAEFGRQPGGQVQLVTRSGTNQFHGTAFEYLRNDAMDAADWIAKADGLPKGEVRQNQFGGVLGGPVIKDKTFFLFSYEGQRLRIPKLLKAQDVPSLRLRQEAAPAVQPFLNAFPVPTGPENQVLQDPSKPYDPSTNPYVPTGGAPFATRFSDPATVDAYSIRMDHQVNGKLSLFGRYAQTPSSSLGRYLNQLQGSVLDNRLLTLGATHSVTPQLNNEFRFNYTSNQGRRSESMDAFGGAVPVTLAQVTSGYSGPGLKRGSVFIFLSHDGFSYNVGNDVSNFTRQFNMVDNVSWVKGSHQLRFGMDWRRLNSIYGPVGFGQFGPFFFSEASLESSTADFLEFFAYKGARPIYDNYSAYLQDAWKLSPRLTMDLGLRWEVNPAPHDANGLRPIVLTGISGVDVSKVAIAPPNVPFYKTFKTAFAPRVGLAYQLNQTSGREIVLRGGFGVYYDVGYGNASTLFGGYPFSATTDLPGSQFPISPTLVKPPAFPAVPTQLPLPTGSSYYALDPNLKLPYTLQWNIALQQSLGNQQTVTLSYVASAARRLITTQNLNRYFSPNPLTFARPNSNIGDIYYAINGPTSDYDSLQAQYQRRLSRGLQALVNYTWSHAIDEASDESTVGGFSLARGNASFDVRHNFSAAVTYDLPKLSGTGSLAEPVARLVKAIANDWSLDSVFYARTGTPLDLTASRFNVTRPDGTIFRERPDVVPGQPFWIKDSTVPGGQRLNPAAFVAPPNDPNPAIPPSYFLNFPYPARQGTLGRNAVYTPGIYQLNMAVRRQFNLGERFSLQFKAEAFNLLNHPLFSGYDPRLPDSTFGQAGLMLNQTLGGLNYLYQTGGPRSMQLSLRLSF